MTKRPTGTATTIECGALFCFIGALPDTSWLPHISTDEDGFIYTDTRIHDLGPQWESLARQPLPFETSDSR